MVPRAFIAEGGLCVIRTDVQLLHSDLPLLPHQTHQGICKGGSLRDLDQVGLDYDRRKLSIGRNVGYDRLLMIVDLLVLVERYEGVVKLDPQLHVVEEHAQILGRNKACWYDEIRNLVLILNIFEYCLLVLARKLVS